VGEAAQARLSIVRDTSGCCVHAPAQTGTPPTCWPTRPTRPAGGRGPLEVPCHLPRQLLSTMRLWQVGGRGGSALELAGEVCLLSQPGCAAATHLSLSAQVLQTSCAMGVVQGCKPLMYTMRCVPCSSFQWFWYNTIWCATICSAASMVQAAAGAVAEAASDAGKAPQGAKLTSYGKDGKLTVSHDRGGLTSCL
jgi:hypothetical protein